MLAERLRYRQELRYMSASHAKTAALKSKEHQTAHVCTAWRNAKLSSTKEPLRRQISGSERMTQKSER